jgi:hypothetical protein
VVHKVGADETGGSGEEDHGMDRMNGPRTARRGQLLPRCGTVHARRARGRTPVFRTWTYSAFDKYENIIK